MCPVGLCRCLQHSIAQPDVRQGSRHHGLLQAAPWPGFGRFCDSLSSVWRIKENSALESVGGLRCCGCNGRKNLASRGFAVMSLGAAVLSDGTADGTAVGTADGTADVADVPDKGSGGWGIVALGLRDSPILGWPAGGVASAKSDWA